MNSCDSQKKTIESFPNVNSGITIYSNEYQFSFELLGDYGIHKQGNKNIFPFIDFKELKAIPKVKFYSGMTFVEPNFSFYPFFYPGLKIKDIDTLLVKDKLVTTASKKIRYSTRKLKEYNLFDLFKENERGVSRLTIIGKRSTLVFESEMNQIINLNNKPSKLDINDIFNSTQSILNSSYLPNYSGVVSFLEKSNNPAEKKRFESLIIQSKAPVEKTYSKLKFDSIFNEYSPVAVKEVIRELVHDKKIVAINENHFNHENRILIGKFLNIFYDCGFRTLFVEGINSDISEPNQINSSIGYYTLNPDFANFLKKALELGFDIKNYESEISCDKEDRKYCNNFRDSIQASNIYDKFETLKVKKAIIFAGFAHINKSSNDSWIKMAEHLAKISGEEIFSIDQSKFGNVEMVRSDYFNYVNDKFEIQEPVFLKSSNDKYFRDNPSQYDVQVFFPRTQNWYEDDLVECKLHYDNQYLGKYLLLYKNEYSFQKIPDKIVKIDNEFLTLKLSKSKHYVFVINELGDIIKNDLIEF